MARTLPHKLFGNINSNKLLVFVHGYPDSTNLWRNYYEKYSKDSYIVSFSYPNFPNTDESEKLKWGIDFLEAIHRMKNTLDKINGEQKRKILFVAHDWGSAISFKFDKEFPGYMSDFIALDVSPTSNRKLSNLLSIIKYQWLLSLCFILGNPIGNWITSSWINSIPIPSLEKEDLKKVNSSMNYFYYYLWRRVFIHLGLIIVSFFITQSWYFWFILVGIIILRMKTIPLIGLELGGYKLPDNLVYIYGKNKPFNFHTDSFLERVRNSKNGKVFELDCGHWIPVEKEEFLKDVISDRLNLL